MKRQPKQKTVTNYRMVINFGKNGKVESVADGRGFCLDKNEVLRMCNSVLSKHKTVISSEVYFNDILIQKK